MHPTLNNNRAHQQENNTFTLTVNERKQRKVLLRSIEWLIAISFGSFGATFLAAIIVDRQDVYKNSDCSAFVLGDLKVREYQASNQHVDPFLSHLDVNSIKAFETATFGDEAFQRPSQTKQKRSDLTLGEIESEIVQVEERAGLLTLVYSLAKIAIAPNPVVAVANGLGAACTIAGLITPKIPTPVKYGCAALTFLGPFLSVWTGKVSVQQAFNQYKNTNSPTQLEFIQMSNMALRVHPPGGRRSIDTSDVYNQTLMHVANLHADVAHQRFTAKQSHFVDVKTKQLVSINHFRGSNQTHPKRVGSYNSWLHHYHMVDLYWHKHQGKHYLASSSVSKQEHYGKRNCNNDSPEGDNEVDQIGDATDDYVAGCGSGEGVFFSYGEDTVGTEGDFQDIDSDVGNYAENIRLNNGWDFANQLVNNMQDDNWGKGCICIADKNDSQMVSTGLVRTDNKIDQWDGLEQCNEQNSACEAATTAS